jgi:hypothetical protein
MLSGEEAFQIPYGLSRLNLDDEDLDPGVEFDIAVDEFEPCCYQGPFSDLNDDHAGPRLPSPSISSGSTTQHPTISPSTKPEIIP